MRVLDEVAEAIKRAGGGTLPIVSAFGLRDQFSNPLEPRLWIAIQRHLACPLPLLEFVPGHGFMPIGCATIWDLADHAALWHPDWEPPAARTETAWREAQIFVGVRITLVETLNVRPEAVIREARLMRDLGMS